MKTPLRAQLVAVLHLAFGVAVLGQAPILTANAAGETLPTRTVGYSDLDLTKPAGVRALYSRITTAARQVCQLGTFADLQLQAEERACLKQAIDGAVRNVNSPALANLRFGTVHLASR